MTRKVERTKGSRWRTSWYNRDGHLRNGVKWVRFAGIDRGLWWLDTRLGSPNSETDAPGRGIRIGSYYVKVLWWR